MRPDPLLGILRAMFALDFLGGYEPHYLEVLPQDALYLALEGVIPEASVAVMGLDQEDERGRYIDIPGIGIERYAVTVRVRENREPGDYNTWTLDAEGRRILNPGAS